MGAFDVYCMFCAGPLDNAYEVWTSQLAAFKRWPPKDGEWDNPPGYPVPTKPKNEIMQITEEDGKYWSEWVCVALDWYDYVSPQCTSDAYGGVFINDGDRWPDQNQITQFFRIHRGCLSFLCHIAHVTPKDIYESIFESNFSQYGIYGGQGLLNCIKYFDMRGRNGQAFGYAVSNQWFHADNPNFVDIWYDPESMEDTNWLLARPTKFIELDDIPSRSSIPSKSIERLDAIYHVFRTPELFDDILDHVITPEHDALVVELKVSDNCATSLDDHAITLFRLLEVDKYFNAYILEERQDLFLSLAHQYGWMLPISAIDWRSWTNGAIHLGRRQPTRDWRRYLLAYLRKEDPHVKNRFRMYKMAMQFARGKAIPGKEWRWSLGELAYVPDIVDDEVKSWVWES